MQIYAIAIIQLILFRAVAKIESGKGIDLADSKTTSFGRSKENVRSYRRKITTEGKKHLGAAIGFERFKNDFVTKGIDEWTKDLIVLA